MSEHFIISVIIPFYNAEKHIENCLKDLKNQDFQKQFEIVMIDDGSNDKGLDNVRKFAIKNLKIFKINKNSGPSAARNYGIKKAKGKYIFFLDVDDSIEVDTLSTLYEYTENDYYDLIFSDKKWIENSKNLRKNKYDFPEEKIFSKQDLHEIMRKRFYDPVSTGKLFGLTGRLIKKSIITENEIFFEESLRYLEDDTYMWDILGHIKNARYVRKQLYAYHVYPNVNTALSEGINKGFPVSNFKLVKKHIIDSLRKNKFSLDEINKISDQGLIFFVISALISFSRSILQGKINSVTGNKKLKNIINDVICDSDILKAIKNYSRAKNESAWIPRAIYWRSSVMLELACKYRAKEILKIRAK